MDIYPILREALFQLDPEQAHHLTVKLLGLSNATGLTGLLYPKQKDNISVEVAGLIFPNRVGLAAGFDKNALYINDMARLGFGHIEIGTVTPKPQEGNPKPRMFRLPEDRALINRMGFNNDGADAIALRLSHIRPKAIIGGNIGKNKSTPNEEAASDYAYCFSKLYPYVDYFTVNVSSPNTPGLRALQEKDSLLSILGTVQNLNHAQPIPRPVFLKIAPDLGIHQLDDIMDIVLQSGISGIIATNTTISRDGLSYNQQQLADIGAGGLSGAPLTRLSLGILKHLGKHLPSSTALISSGGIMSADDAHARLDSGAHLVQLYTGFIYQGPDLIRNIIIDSQAHR